MSSTDVIGLLVIAVVLLALIRVLFWPKRSRNKGSDPGRMPGTGMFGGRGGDHDSGDFGGGDGGGGD